MHGYKLMKDSLRRVGRRLGAGKVYRELDRLAHEGWCGRRVPSRRAMIAALRMRSRRPRPGGALSGVLGASLLRCGAPSGRTRPACRARPRHHRAARAESEASASAATSVAVRGDSSLTSFAALSAWRRRRRAHRAGSASAAASVARFDGVPLSSFAAPKRCRAGLDRRDPHPGPAATAPPVSFPERKLQGCCTKPSELAGRLP